MKKNIIKSIIGVALTASVLGGVLISVNYKTPVKEADAWAESPWYYIGDDTDWKWTDDNIFTLNESINRYYSPVITLSGQKFKLTLGTSYNTQITCDDWGYQSPSVDWSEWDDYCSGTSDNGNFQFNDSGKRIQFWYKPYDMSTYEKPGYAVHIEEYHEYKVTSGGSSVTLSRVSNDSNYTRYQGYLDLTKGQSVSLSRDEGGIDYITQRSNKNNIEASSKTILETATHCLITLRFQNSNAYYLHANGRTVAWYLVLDGTFHSMAVNTAESAGHYMYTNLDLAKDQSFNFYDNTSHFPTDSDFSQDSGLDFTASLRGIKCNTAGTYNIYLDATNNNVKAHIGKQSEADKVALAYANYFLNQFEGSRGGVCNGTGSGDAQYEESLSAAWTRTSSNYSNGVNKNADAKDIIKNADPHSDNVYGQFAALYDKVFRDYGTKLSLNNYAGRTISSSGAAVKILPGLTNSDESSNIVMVVVVSSITVISVIGFTFLKKRKEK